jgi:hypothetical protein
MFHIQLLFNVMTPYLEIILKYFQQFVIFNKKCNNFVITKI